MKSVVLLVVTLFCFIQAHELQKLQTTSTNGCFRNGECRPSHYCDGDPIKQIEGKCQIKFEDFCQNDQHCLNHGEDYFMTCQKSGGKKNKLFFFLIFKCLKK